MTEAAKLRQQILQLRLQRKKDEEFLAHFGLGDSDLNSDFASMLNSFATIKQEIGLEPLNELTLQSWYLQQKHSIIELGSILHSLQQSKNKLCAAITAKRTECDEIQFAIENCVKNTVPPNEVDKRKQKLEATIERLNKQLVTTETSAEHLIDDIIEKLERMKQN